MKFNRLRFNADTLEPHHMSLDGEYRSFLLVSETLRDSFDVHRFKGYAFAVSTR